MNVIKMLTLIQEYLKCWKTLYLFEFDIVYSSLNTHLTQLWQLTYAPIEFLTPLEQTTEPENVNHFDGSTFSTEFKIKT